MSDDSRAGYQAVFRERWRERQSAGNRLGELIRQPRWLNAGLVALAGLLATGAVAAATVTVSRSAVFPAVVDGVTLTAVRGSGPAPVVGSPAHFRDSSGATVDAVVVAVAPSEVIARLTRPTPASAGQLLVPAGSQRLFEVLAPRLG